jgi:hypothetical protein
MHKTHVHQPVGFIDHQDLYLFYWQIAFQIDLHEAPGRGHNNVHTCSNSLSLCFYSNTTVQRKYSQVGVFGHRLSVISQLKHKLFCWPKHNHAWVCSLGILDLHQYRQDISGRFAGTCLGNANDLLSAKDQWNALLLDVSGCVEPKVSDRVQQLAIQIKILKGCYSRHDLL